MSDWIIIRTGATPADGAAWAVFHDASLVESGRVETISALVPIAERYADEIRIGVILPGELAAMRKMPAPPRKMAKLKSAAYLLLEDELAAPIEAHHIAIERRPEDAIITAISTDQMSAWMQVLSEAGVTPDLVTVDFLCLGGTDSEGVLFIEHGRVAASLGAQGFSAEAELVKPLIASFMTAREEATIGVYKMSDAGMGAGAAHYHHLGESGDVAMMTLAVSAAVAGKAPNLLQGNFRPARKQLIHGARWRRPAMMAAALGAVFLVATLADGLRSGRIADRFDSEAARIHAEAFPEASDDIRSTARSVLANGAAGGPSFLAVSDVLARALETHEDVSIDRVRYDRTSGQYAFSIRSASDAEIAAFRETLSAFGAASQETGGYRRSGAFWVGDMTVTMS